MTQKKQTKVTTGQDALNEARDGADDGGQAKIAEFFERGTDLVPDIDAAKEYVVTVLDDGKKRAYWACEVGNPLMGTVEGITSQAMEDGPAEYLYVKVARPTKVDVGSGDDKVQEVIEPGEMLHANIRFNMRGIVDAYHRACRDGAVLACAVEPVDKISRGRRAVWNMRVRVITIPVKRR